MGSFFVFFVLSSLYLMDGHEKMAMFAVVIF